MKVLLTKEEYEERAINVVIDAAKDLIYEHSDDYLKWNILHDWFKKCFNFESMRVDIIDQFFFKVFRYDRNGKSFDVENLIQINEREIEEFESQEWYIKYVEQCKENYYPIESIQPVLDKEFLDVNDEFFDIIRVLLIPFTSDINIPYYLANKAFKRLYGYEYQMDKNFKLDNEIPELKVAEYNLDHKFSDFSKNFEKNKAKLLAQKPDKMKGWKVYDNDYFFDVSLVDNDSSYQIECWYMGHNDYNIRKWSIKLSKEDFLKE